MIAIACATSDEHAFRAGAATAIGALDDGSSLLLRRHRFDSIDVPYNEMLAIAAARDDLDAVVFVHQDTVLDRPDEAGQAIRALVGGTDGLGADGLVMAWSADGRHPHDVSAIGTLIALSAAAARSLRFDAAVGGSADAAAHDLALQVRERGGRVVGAALGARRAAMAEEPQRRRRAQRAAVALRRKWALADVVSPGR